jgi:hypothetical protein
LVLVGVSVQVLDGVQVFDGVHVLDGVHVFVMVKIPVRDGIRVGGKQFGVLAGVNVGVLLGAINVGVRLAHGGGGVDVGRLVGRLVDEAVQVTTGVIGVQVG